MAVPACCRTPASSPSPLQHDYPISDDAARYYKSGRSFAYRYLPFWLASLANRAVAVLVPIIVLLIPGLRAVPALYGWRINNRIYSRYAELMGLERAVVGPLTEEERVNMMSRLAEIERSVIDARIPGAYLQRNSVHVSDYFKLPPDAVVELGREIAI